MSITQSPSEKLAQIAPEAAQVLESMQAVIQGLLVSAYEDSITQLMNGVALSKFEKARDRAHTFGAVFTDLSGFKEINDRYGHDAGDAALYAAGSKLASIAAQRSAYAFRKSGDEFVLLTRDARSARHCAEDVVAVFGQGFDVPFQDTHLRVRGAVGYSVRQDNETTLTVLVSQADAACRRAKLEGGSRALEWSPEMSTEESVSLRKRCLHCQATTTLLVDPSRKRPEALSRCGNCGSEYSPVEPEESRGVA